jgi:hypothetical protein
MILSKGSKVLLSIKHSLSDEVTDLTEIEAVIMYYVD